VRFLRERGAAVDGLYYNPNIHPFTEYERRRATLQEYATGVDLRLIGHETYAMEEFIRAVAYREEHRCRHCYFMRLNYAARIAREEKYDCFTSTLLYSRFQNHELIREMGTSIGKKEEIDFFYHDFREGWKEGVEISKKNGMYRQQYCGCIYSERARFDRSLPARKG